MTRIHNLGFPRIGHQRELKKTLEAYWQGDINSTALLEAGKKLRQQHWQLQREAGLDLIPVGDFSWYDHVLDHSLMFGVIPERFGKQGEALDLDGYFRMARGHSHCGHSSSACEMTKWFDTNYHYIVPEFDAEQPFTLSSTQLFEHVNEALALGYPVKPVLIGPLTYLWLGKTKGQHFDKLRLLPALTKVYQQILRKLAQQGVSWVQIDEPILGLDLPSDWLTAFVSCYEQLHSAAPAILLTSYFSELQNNLEMACHLPVAGLHIDAIRAANEVDKIVRHLPSSKILSLGLLDGRNIWRADLRARLAQAQQLKSVLGDRLWLAPSCSLLHVPVDLHLEKNLDAELKSWLAFAVQKLDELALLKQGLNEGTERIEEALKQSDAAQSSRKQSPRIHNQQVKQRCATINTLQIDRHAPYPERIRQQHAHLKLPLFPTTTIGSFPQTEAIRLCRRDFKQGRLAETQYQQKIKAEIAHAVKIQEQIGLDVLVHGEAERNDMVEYFGEQLQGFAFSSQGWVQSYGSRCVKPPILYGDVSRPRGMTLDWILYAQSLTNKPMKGMLTGPVTMLNWSFVRDDQSRAESCKQIALALRDEVLDLEEAGIRIIQIDEAALREGLPLRKNAWKAYLDWSVESFKITAGGVKDSTQIHTHMCYSEFNDIIESIAAMDADVITIETARSDMKLLDAFERFAYPNDIGPGVYDIHSPNLPTSQSIVTLINKATRYIPAERLWINPDCGLKTRQWPEVESALTYMVQAAQHLREARTNPVKAEFSQV